MRQQAVKEVRNGETVTSVAAALGVNIRTVFRWLADFAEGGQNALLAKPIPGRPPKLDAEQLRWVAETVRDKTPWQMKFEFGLWTLALIGEVIYQKYRERLTKTSVSRVLRCLDTRHRSQSTWLGSRIQYWWRHGRRNCFQR